MQGGGFGGYTSAQLAEMQVLMSKRQQAAGNGNMGMVGVGTCRTASALVS